MSLPSAGFKQITLRHGTERKLESGFDDVDLGRLDRAIEPGPEVFITYDSVELNAEHRLDLPGPGEQNLVFRRG